MAKIMVEIRCSSRYCGYCDYQFDEDDDKYCGLFLLPLAYCGNFSGDLNRLSECIATEMPREYSTAAFKALTRFYEETKGLKSLTTDEIDELYGVARVISTEVKE